VATVLSRDGESSCMIEPGNPRVSKFFDFSPKAQRPRQLSC
jgi:hypothetical protein